MQGWASDQELEEHLKSLKRVERKKSPNPRLNDSVSIQAKAYLCLLSTPFPSSPLTGEG
jgi:hypothetical protein